MEVFMRYKNLSRIFMKMYSITSIVLVHYKWVRFVGSFVISISATKINDTGTYLRFSVLTH